MLEKLQKITFLLIVFFLSSQVGFHFWPEFSKVSGIRVDYLSPTFYLLDILIIIWLGLLGVLGWLRKIIVNIQNPLLKSLLLLFVLGLIINTFFARSQGAHVFGLIKFGELGLFGWFVAKTFKKKDISVFVRVFALSAIISFLLTIWQFMQQSSIGGLWYFLGERTFNISTIGISTVNLGQQILRPYAAFPHPNVLAVFLLTAITLMIFRLPYEKNSFLKISFIAGIILSIVSLFLTFSRIIILLAICIVIYAIFTKGKRNALFIVPALIIMFVLLNFVMPELLMSQFLFRGVDFRQELLTQSFQIFSNNPYFGIGLNNFFVHQVDLIKNISPILFQPPHNIFVIALLSLGIFGWWIFPYIFIRAVRDLLRKIRDIRAVREIKDFYVGVLIILIAIIVVGMFDHFFLTLEQGQIMLALILGLSFARLK